VIAIQESEGISEQVDRFAVRRAPCATLEIANRPHAQPRSLGQSFLGEASRHPVVAEESRERGGWGVLHHALLARSIGRDNEDSSAHCSAYHGDFRLSSPRTSRAW
jgi:hypothetical protein